VLNEGSNEVVSIQNKATRLDGDGLSILILLLFGQKPKANSQRLGSIKKPRSGGS
jgi:hypothetical protein